MLFYVTPSHSDNGSKFFHYLENQKYCTLKLYSVFQKDIRLYSLDQRQILWGVIYNGVFMQKPVYYHVAAKPTIHSCILRYMSNAIYKTAPMYANSIYYIYGWVIMYALFPDDNVSFWLRHLNGLMEPVFEQNKLLCWQNI